MAVAGRGLLTKRVCTVKVHALLPLVSKGNPWLCRGNKKAYGVEESRKEKVSKLE